MENESGSANVVTHPSTAHSSRSGNGGGNGWRRETDQRLTRLEKELGHLATKKDISDLKVWILGSVMAVGGIVVAVLRLWPAAGT